MEAYCKRINRNCETPESTCLDCLLDKIRDEIDQKQYDFMGDKDYDEGIRFGLMLAYQIIDKYKGDNK